ncbi:hypothetical protein [Porphyromonas sp.]|uniref:hypothetical protein n=1 Tax=Porphyromonas sp. TaxID=1924944 RepID=UPI0026DC399D|nr:hypothetical protein [Porphyromonas sp.]MDO4695835.1 hypothetical protein [Porphyromonas sp.]MDO4771407.1 hypothetical protein [Porphyromonas sp.]
MIHTLKTLKWRVLLSLGLSLLAVTVVVGQEPATSKKWHHKIKDYIYGDPWKYDSVLYTTHTKVMLGVGRARIADSYLSPLTHAGADFRLKVFIDAPERTKIWHWYQDIEVNFSPLDNPANGSVLYHLGGEYSVGPLFKVYDKFGFRVNAGGLFNLNARTNLKLSNTNNVANVKASTGLDLMGRAVYRAEFGSYPIMIGYSTQLSLFHLTFSPEYGQSYYDYISNQNRESIKLYPVFPNSRFNFRQRAVVDIPIHNTTVSLGVEHLYHSALVNKIKYEQSHVLFLIGCSFDMVRMAGGKSFRSKYILNSYHQ